MRLTQDELLILACVRLLPAQSVAAIVRHAEGAAYGHVDISSSMFYPMLTNFISRSAEIEAARTTDREQRPATSTPARKRGRETRRAKADVTDGFERWFQSFVEGGGLDDTSVVSEDVERVYRARKGF